jgi:hypothetical protein
MGYGDLAIVFAILVSFLGACGILYTQFRLRHRRDAGLRGAARQLGGKFAVGEGFELSSLHFTVEGRPAHVEYEPGEPSSTRVRVSLARRSPGVFRIFRDPSTRAQARFSGSPDLKIGHAEFDRVWYITARPESLARRIFTEDRREQVIESVLRIGALPVPSIEITRDTLTVRSDGLLRRESDILAMARTAMDFVGYVFRLGPEEGIAWVAGGETDPGLCPVCASVLAEAVIFCDKCKTPQHEECWVYVGQCSTYACKGKRFVG